MKIVSLFIVFCVLVLLQVSFWPHFKLPFVFNFVLLGIVLLNIFEEPSKHNGFFCALVTGFFVDIFSSGFIGFWVLALTAISFFIKVGLKRYIRPVWSYD